MKFYVETLDRRHTGHLLWKYRLRIQTSLDLARSRYRNFHVLRSWMIEQYGVSSERDSYVNIAVASQGYNDGEPFNPPWCWHIDRDYPNAMYIYVKNHEVLSNITLKWV